MTARFLKGLHLRKITPWLFVFLPLLPLLCSREGHAQQSAPDRESYYRAVEYCRGDVSRPMALMGRYCALMAASLRVWTCHGRGTSKRVGSSSFVVSGEAPLQRLCFRISFATVTRRWSLMIIAFQPAQFFFSSRRIRHMCSKALLSPGTIPGAVMLIVLFAAL
jgi:hypothetical protein